jgi:hypothetical protein
VQPLVQTRQLHELRISVELQDGLIRYVFDDRLEWSSILSISFSRGNHLNFWYLQQHVVWHRFQFFDCNGAYRKIPFFCINLSWCLSQ